MLPLQKDFDENADASEYSTDGSKELKYSAEDGLNYAAENDDDPTVAGRVKRSNRKRTLPDKFRSLMKSEKKKGMFYVTCFFIIRCANLVMSYSI